MKITADHIGVALATTEEAPHGRNQFRRGFGTSTADGVALHVLVEHLIGIEVGAVAGPAAQVDPPGVCAHPSRDACGPVNRMAVDDQENLPRNLADQSFEEVQEHPILEPLAEDHEVHSPPVGDGGDHSAPDPLPRPREARRLPPAPVGPSRHMVGTHPQLVSPVNLGSLPLCPRPDRRVLLVQPPAHPLRVPLKGKDAPASAGETPTAPDSAPPPTPTDG